MKAIICDSCKKTIDVDGYIELSGVCEISIKINLMINKTDYTMMNFKYELEKVTEENTYDLCVSCYRIFIRAISKNLNI